VVDHDLAVLRHVHIELYGVGTPLQREEKSR